MFLSVHSMDGKCTKTTNTWCNIFNVVLRYLVGKCKHSQPTGHHISLLLISHIVLPNIFNILVAGSQDGQGVFTAYCQVCGELVFGPG